jgi:hypothetical protein
VTQKPSWSSLAASRIEGARADGPHLAAWLGKQFEADAKPLDEVSSGYSDDSSMGNGAQQKPLETAERTATAET